VTAAVYVEDEAVAGERCCGVRSRPGTAGFGEADRGGDDSGVLEDGYEPAGLVQVVAHHGRNVTWFLDRCGEEELLQRGYRPTRPLHFRHSRSDQAVSCDLSHAGATRQRVRFVCNAASPAMTDSGVFSVVPDRDLDRCVWRSLFQSSGATLGASGVFEERRTWC
jgi:hypothetical protein